MSGNSFNGLNGTIMLNAPDSPGVWVGTVDGAPYGYPRFRLSVSVELRLERLERQDEYETTEHDKVSRPLEFAMTTSVWQPSKRDIVSGGATREPLREVAAQGSFGEGWDADKLAQLADLGDRWHLNSLKAGCSHQTVVYEESDYGTRPSLELTEPCPVTGYKYGHAWLVEPLPADFVSTLLELLADVDPTRIYVNPELRKED